MTFIIISLYLALIIGYIIYPLIGTYIVSFWFKKKSRFIFISCLIIQFIVLSILYFNPIITYDKQVQIRYPENLSNFNFQKGFYSHRYPLIAFRFHVLKQETNSTTIKINYFPYGSRVISWIRGDGYSMEQDFLSH